MVESIITYWFFLSTSSSAKTRSHTPARAPAHEPRMHALVLAIALRKIVPAGSRPQYPQNTVDELAVVGRGPPHMLHPTRKRILDPFPLRLAQLIPTRHIPTAT